MHVTCQLKTPGLDSAQLHNKGRDKGEPTTYEAVEAALVSTDIALTPPCEYNPKPCFR
jgi:hypothetical protein